MSIPIKNILTPAMHEKLVLNITKPLNVRQTLRLNLNEIMVYLFNK